MSHVAYSVQSFVDGAYLRRIADNAGVPWVNPKTLSQAVSRHRDVQDWNNPSPAGFHLGVTRVTYYDARPDEDSDADSSLLSYWAAVELLPDTHLGFGSVRGGTRTRPPRQKGVDTLIAVDMLVGGFEKTFDAAILLAGDADFVPIVRELGRRGIMVVLGADPTALAEDLRRCCDRFVQIGPDQPKGWFPPLEVDGVTWKRTP